MSKRDGKTAGTIKDIQVVLQKSAYCIYTFQD